MNRDDRIRLGHMLDAANEALSFVEGRSRDDLTWNRMLLHALVRNIEILGEAAVHVSQGFKQDSPGIPWAKLTGMRNRVVHAYFDIDYDIVWDTTVRDLAPLIEELNMLLAKAPE